VGSRLDRNVASGAPVISRLAYPFDNACGHRLVTIEVRYSKEPGADPVLVGGTTVRKPPVQDLLLFAVEDRRHEVCGCPSSASPGTTSPLS
jgi:hypothetical protein